MQDAHCSRTQLHSQLLAVSYVMPAVWLQLRGYQGLSTVQLKLDDRYP
jgi:hypothetical protein